MQTLPRNTPNVKPHVPYYAVKEVQAKSADWFEGFKAYGDGVPRNCMTTKDERRGWDDAAVDDEGDWAAEHEFIRMGC